MMNRKIFTIILSLALLGSFFMPYISIGIYGGASGYDIVFQPGGAGEWEKYVWLLIPLSAIILLIGALNNEHYFLGRGLFCWLPLLTIIYFIVRLFLSIKGEGKSAPIMEYVKIFGVGFWVTLVISLLLAFVNPKRK